MTPTHPIKTRDDGSIDTAFYMAQGRTRRSQAALGLCAALRRGLGRMVKSSKAPVAPERGGQVATAALPYVAEKRAA